MEDSKTGKIPDEPKIEGLKKTKYGQVDVADSVIYDLIIVGLNKIEEVVKDQKNIRKAVSIDRKATDSSVSVSVSVKLYLTRSIREVAETIQSVIKEEVEGMTGLIKVESITVNVLDIEIPDREVPIEDEEPPQQAVPSQDVEEDHDTDQKMG